MKIKYFIYLFVTILLVSGCSSKKSLTCTMETTDSGLKMTQTIGATFKNDKISNMEMKLEAKAVESSIKENWDLFISSLDSEFKNYKNSDGISVKTQNDKNNYIYNFSINIDLNRAKEDDLLGLDLDIKDSSDTYESFKEEATKEGYTCK